MKENKKARESLPSGEFDSTAELKVPKKLIDQVVGQEKAVEITRKAAAQKRNVLLICTPGTGKSMLAQAMAEILPLSQLNDLLVYPNESDPNNPKVRTVKAGEGKKIVQQTRTDAQAQENNTRLLGFILPLGWFILSMVIWQLGWISDIIYAATLILGGFLVVGFALGTQFRSKASGQSPKLLVDNSGKKTAPFIEGTGARAGALLGDVRHDPLQCHSGFNSLLVQNGENFEEKPFAELWDEMHEKYGKEIIRNEKGYEAIMLPPEEKVFTLGYKDGKVVVSRILSLNRQPFEGKMVDLKVGAKTVSLTPEHKIDTAQGTKEAEKVSEKDGLIKLVKHEIARIFN